MAETRVDLLHLLEDLRDAYAGSLEETILTELVANALDSGARTIRLDADPAHRTFTVTDDGSGMNRVHLRQFHDIASTTKTRGEGIGFAGVGVKLGLLASEQVLTETRRGAGHVATAWHLATRHRAPWRWVPPPGLVESRGTAVRLTLGNPLSPLLDVGFVESALEEVFRPLLDPAFDEILAPHYPDPVRFIVQQRELARQPTDSTRVPIAVRLGRKRKPSAVGYLTRSAIPVPSARRGLGISTLGKLIREGWDWLGLTPADSEHIAGLIEAPALAECLTLNKADFIRVGRRGMVFLAYRKAIQEAVTEQLALWGDVREAADEARRRRARPVERDLEHVLLALADDFPMLASLVERRPGGQRRLEMARPAAANEAPADDACSAPLVLVGVAGVGEEVAPSPSADTGPRQRPETPQTEAHAGRDGSSGAPAGRQRPAHYGLSIGFVQRPEDGEISRLVDNVVWVNESHPSYRRAAASRSDGYHLALAVALALAPLAVENKDVHAFVTTFLGHWGDAVERPRRRGRSRRR